MKHKLIIGFTGIAILSMLLVSCSREPKAEFDAANNAIEKAKDVGADIYLQNEFADLKNSMSVITLKIEEQRSSTSRDYAGIKEKLIELTTHAQKLEQKSMMRKEETCNEIQTMMNEIQKIIEENGKLIVAMSEKNKNEAEFNIISNEQKEVDILVSESNVLLQDGNYMATLNKVKTAKEKALFINKDLQELTSKDKTSSKPKKTS